MYTCMYAVLCICVCYIIVYTIPYHSTLYLTTLYYTLLYYTYTYTYIIYSGEDDLGCEYTYQGASGVISVTANVAPKKMHE